jgi:hypothetical protein
MNRTTYAGVALRLAAILLALTALPPVLRADEAKPWLTLVNVADALSNVQGGIRPGTRYLDKLDLSTPRIGDALGWTRTEVFLDVQGTTASNFNALTGSTQGISNIDAPAGVRVLDAWIAQNLGATGRIKAGIVDFNSEFDLQPTGTLFLNPSHGIGPDISRTGFNGPSIFPSTGLGLVGQWNPGQAWELKSGIFQGQPGNPNHPGRSVCIRSTQSRDVRFYRGRRYMDLYRCLQLPRQDLPQLWKFWLLWDRGRPSLGQRATGAERLAAHRHGEQHHKPAGLLSRRRTCFPWSLESRQ